MTKFFISLPIALTSLIVTTMIYAADSSTTETGGSALSSMLPLIMIMIVFYFVLIRPQNKKAKEHKNMIETLDRGAKVVINSGIIGTISKVEKEKGQFIIEIAPNVYVSVLKESIAQLLDNKNSGIKNEKQEKQNEQKTDTNKPLVNAKEETITTTVAAKKPEAKEVKANNLKKKSNNKKNRLISSKL